jgi:hypothetical protein
MFIQTKSFTSEAKRLRLSLDDVRQIENEISVDPTAWPVIAGSKGLRKMRFASEQSGRGKSGGHRVCYFIVDDAKHIYLATLFGKNESANLSKADCRVLAGMITDIKARYEKRGNS